MNLLNFFSKFFFFKNDPHYLTLLLIVYLLLNCILKTLLFYTETDSLNSEKDQNTHIIICFICIVLYLVLLIMYELFFKKRNLVKKIKFESFFLFVNISLIIIYNEFNIHFFDYVKINITIFDGMRFCLIEIIFLNNFLYIFTKYFSILLIMVYLNFRIDNIKNIEIYNTLFFFIIIFLYIILTSKFKSRSEILEMSISFNKKKKKIDRFNENNEILDNFFIKFIEKLNDPVIILNSKEILYSNPSFLSKISFLKNKEYSDIMKFFDIDILQIPFDLSANSIKISTAKFPDPSTRKNDTKHKKLNLLIQQYLSENFKEYKKPIIGKMTRIELTNKLEIRKLLNKEEEYNIYIDIFQIFAENTQILLFFNIRKSHNEEKIQELSNLIESQYKMLSHVSHEMRTPLNCIIGMIQSIEGNINQFLSERIIDPVLSSGKYLLNMINDLLDMSQLRSGKFILNEIEFDLTLLFKDIFSLFQIYTKQKALELRYTIDDQIPNLIKGDPNRLKQVIVNLLGNAFKYTKSGTIELICSKYNDMKSIYQISVIDTGLGIKPEDKDKLFKAFGKIINQENTLINPQGVGLGIIISDSLAKNFVNNYQIDESEKGLKFESEYGKGTCFSFIFEDKKKIDVYNEENYYDTNDVEPLDYKYNRFLSNSSKIKFSNYRNKDLDLSPFFKNSEKTDSKSFNIMVKKNISTFSTDKPFSSFNGDKNMIISSKNIQKTNFSSGVLKMLSQNDLYLPKQTSSSVQRASLFSDMNISFSSKTSNLMKQEDLNTKIDELPNKINNKKCNCPDVLICDDHIFNIVALQFLLESFNLIVDSTNGGEEALLNIVNYTYKHDTCCENYKLIFLDIEMPGKDGFETCEDISNFFKKTNNVETKIIACTGHNEPEYIQKFYQYGFTKHLIKPIMKGCLAALLIEYYKN